MSRRALLKGSALLAASGSPRAASAPSLQGANASLVADALRAVGRDPEPLTMSPEIRPLTTASAPVFGPAVTTKWVETREGGMEPGAIRKFVFEPIDGAGAGSVWVVASGTERLLSMFGDLIGLACKHRELAGALTDSGCRDTAAISAYGFPVFAKGTVLYGPGTVIRPVAANVPVVCGGVTVRPGDVVVADVDGVIVVPREAVADVARAKDAILVKENAVRQKIEHGVPLASAYSL